MNPINKWQNWPFKNTFLLVVSLFIFFFFANSDFIQNFIRKIGDLGYPGAFITGIFFVYTFTVAPAAVVLFRLADLLNPFGVAILAGLGAVLGDYLIFRYFRDRVIDELRPIFKKVPGSKIAKLFFTPYFAWILPLAGFLIIASPFPDEVGVGLIGASKMKNWQFLILTFLLNAVGIFIVVTLARSF